jgi:hypothetical protein
MSNNTTGGLTLWLGAGHGHIVIFPAGTVSVKYFEPLYRYEMELFLTWQNLQQPLVEHGVRVAALSKQGKRRKGV